MSLALAFQLLHSSWDQQRPGGRQFSEIVHVNKAGSKGIEWQLQCGTGVSFHDTSYVALKWEGEKHILVQVF